MAVAKFYQHVTSPFFKHRNKVCRDQLLQERTKEISAIGSTDNARNVIKKLGMNITLNETMPGIPGILLVQGRFSNQNVIVLLFSEKSNKGMDLENGAKLCLAMGTLIPNLPCNLKLINSETVKVEKMIKKTQKGSKHINDRMYV